jgi:hypothetical protein
VTRNYQQGAAWYRKASDRDMRVQRSIQASFTSTDGAFSRISIIAMDLYGQAARSSDPSVAQTAIKLTGALEQTGQAARAQEGDNAGMMIIGGVLGLLFIGSLLSHHTTGGSVAVTPDDADTSGFEPGEGIGPHPV